MSAFHAVTWVPASYQPQLAVAARLRRHLDLPNRLAEFVSMRAACNPVTRFDSR